MEFTFQTGKLRKELTEQKAMDRAYGSRSSALRRRLAILRNARCLAEVPKNPPDRCHKLTTDRHGQFAVVIKDNWRLIFAPDHDPVPQLPDGGVDEAAVTKIRLIEVIDYH